MPNITGGKCSLTIQDWAELQTISEVLLLTMEPQVLQFMKKYRMAEEFQNIKVSRG
jgi:hypothetical protein